MGKTDIQWTDFSWNPVTGCTKVSQGCKNCYAERVFQRTVSDVCKCGRHKDDHVVFGGVGDGVETPVVCEGFEQRQFTDVLTHPDRLEHPLHWRKPRRIFVNSMSDLFHEDVPYEFIKQVWDVAAKARQHTYQILTKRPERMLEFARWMAGADDISTAEWPGNCWLGISCEDQKTTDERIPILLKTPAAVRFVSYEPALGPVDFTKLLQKKTGYTSPDLATTSFDALRGKGTYPSRVTNIPIDVEGNHLDQIIVGGESGPGARPFNIQWASDVIAQCKAAGVPCFVKQLGAVPVMNETEWRNQKPLTPLLNAARHNRAICTDLTVPLKFTDKKGGDWNEWPEDLRVREYPR